jgi:hypothetical protein
MGPHFYMCSCNPKVYFETINLNDWMSLVKMNLQTVDIRKRNIEYNGLKLI